jgi:hypothetical protein
VTEGYMRNSQFSAHNGELFFSRIATQIRGHNDNLFVFPQWLEPSAIIGSWIIKIQNM